MTGWSREGGEEGGVPTITVNGGIVGVEGGGGCEGVFEVGFGGWWHVGRKAQDVRSTFKVGVI